MHYSEAGVRPWEQWDTELFEAWGAAMGKEFAGKGANVQFGCVAPADERPG